MSANPAVDPKDVASLRSDRLVRPMTWIPAGLWTTPDPGLDALFEAEATGAPRQDPLASDHRIESCHIRAARGLLDWSMQDLAEASGLSFSTVRRLEEGRSSRASRSRRAALATLRQAGIRFLLLEGGSLVAVARAP